MSEVSVTPLPQIWHRGPPPHAGWWCTRDHVPSGSSACVVKYWSWWDGTDWYMAADNSQTDETAGRYAKCLITVPRYMPEVWCDYWPEGARVPRTNPLVSIDADEAMVSISTGENVLKLHGQLAEDIRNVPWYSNCAGEIHVDNGKRGHTRIGHFQGDAAIAEFVVAAHEKARLAAVAA